jgi:hypothetical protein
MKKATFTLITISILFLFLYGCSEVIPTEPQQQKIFSLLPMEGTIKLYLLEMLPV